MYCSKKLSIIYFIAYIQVVSQTKNVLTQLTAIISGISIKDTLEEASPFLL